MNLNEKEIALLKETVNATNNNTVIYANSGEMVNMVALQLVEGNPQLINPANGGMAYRATPAGQVYAQNLAAAASVPPAPVPAVPAAPAAPAVAGGGFSVGAGFQPPAKGTRRASNNGRTYPFETLELGGYIFVPATEKRPDPKKSLASTISGANKRFENFSPRRYFKTYRAAEGQVFGAVIAPSAGAYIVRVEPPVDTPDAPAV